MTRSNRVGEVLRVLIDQIPTIWVKPTSMGSGTPLALWLPPLGGDKESGVPFLQELAATGRYPSGSRVARQPG
jgi:hypothetical protein